MIQNAYSHLQARTLSSGARDEAAALHACLALWRDGNRAQARAQVASVLSQHPGTAAFRLAEFAFRDVFHEPIHGRHLDLVRRSPADAGFVRSTWSDRAFMDHFHRMAPCLPAADAALAELLERERMATLLDSTNLHWTMVTHSGERIGMASLVEISLPHGRAEFVIGVPGKQTGAALEASLLLLEFAFGAMRLHKICSVVYGQNDYALRSTRHLGFASEGLLKDHVRDGAAGCFVSLHMSALFQNDFLSSANQRLALRLLKRPLAVPQGTS